MKDKIWISPDRTKITVPEDVNPVFIFHMTLGHIANNSKEKEITACTGGKFIHFTEQDYPTSELWNYDGLIIYFTRVQLNAIHSFFTNGNQDTKEVVNKNSSSISD